MLTTVAPAGAGLFLDYRVIILLAGIICSIIIHPWMIQQKCVHVNEIKSRCHEHNKCLLEYIKSNFQSVKGIGIMISWYHICLVNFCFLLRFKYCSTTIWHNRKEFHMKMMDNWRLRNMNNNLCHTTICQVLHYSLSSSSCHHGWDFLLEETDPRSLLTGMACSQTYPPIRMKRRLVEITKIKAHTVGMRPTMAPQW